MSVIVYECYCSWYDYEQASDYKIISNLVLGNQIADLKFRLTIEPRVYRLEVEVYLYPVRQWI